ASNGYKKVWAGGVSGGLWFTNDITANQITWNKVNDFMDNLAINAIAQNPINAKEIYIGTGDVYAFGIQGNGVYKTIDGGVTWNKLSSTS
ncbi:WD40/YVTN/BNR-like repeat-containing protein, partial [Klebsiella pneumoniae]|uniref:WD40/YVTN/BNR-like repeat-containing protein n=1 Tax=Klebsiella pneumoniae TaxID=573 RepID=UPI003851DC69